MKKVTVVDYGVGNLLSVRRAFECFGADVEVTFNQKKIQQAERLVLPGVGAFESAMSNLREKCLIGPILSFTEFERPFMGICLGMQMMLESSEEYGNHEGLGLIAGKVVPIPKVGTDNRPHKTPHIGWNALTLPQPRKDWQETPLQNTLPGEFFYFVHSFMAELRYKENRLADCSYNGLILSAAIHKNNLLGCQFHPEKSGPSGLKLIQQFLA